MEILRYFKKIGEGLYSVYTIQKFLNAKNPEQSFALFLVNTVGAFQWDKIVLI
jgi:hypothetical protein